MTRRKQYLRAAQREERLRANVRRFREAHALAEPGAEELYFKISGLWYEAWHAAPAYADLLASGAGNV